MKKRYNTDGFEINPHGEECMPRYWIWYQEALNKRVDSFLKKVARYRFKRTPKNMAEVLKDALRFDKWDQKQVDDLRKYERGGGGE